MSILGKKWLIKNVNGKVSVKDRLMVNRELTEENQIQKYLYPDRKSGLHDPFLMKDMGNAVHRIEKAIQSCERIIIFGDYDVDGISGTAILYHTLKTLGAQVSYRLPHRLKDGYGLSNTFVEDFAKAGAKLIITVDCGISCKTQIEMAKNHGIDTIVTDHHTLPKNFPHAAYAVLHPLQPDCKYPFKGLTGAGVAYKLASALISNKFSGDERDEHIFSLLDLASLGTIADIGPIQDENRVIVKYGLEALKNTKWPGLKFLKENAGIKPNEKINVHMIGFRISPRINAAGRIDHPYFALQLLLSDECGAKAEKLALHLEKLNNNRRQMVVEAVEEAEKQYFEATTGTTAGAATSSDIKIFIGWSARWHVGILGLIASRFVEKYGIPCIILQDFGEHLVASARSMEDFNIIEALTFHSDYLEHFGGHAQAAGFSVKKTKLTEFVEAMTAYAETKLAQKKNESVVKIDCELGAEDVNEDLMKFLEQMEPFGHANEQPIFLIKDVSVAFAKKVGKEQKHLSFRASVDDKKVQAIAYGFGQHHSILERHSKLDLVCNLERNVWNGRSSLQLKVIDMATINV